MIPLLETQYFKPIINQNCGSSELIHHVGVCDVLGLSGAESHACSEVRW